MLLVFCFALFLVTPSVLSINYKAVVLEYAHNATASSPSEIIKGNLQKYREKINELKGQGTDIFVFPEYGLTGRDVDVSKYSISLPDPNTNSGNYTDIIKELSDIATEHNTLLAINLLENSINSDNQVLYYNTIILLDKKGTIVAKYRKINLNNEPKLTPGNETVVYPSDFNVKFGLMTSNDILYENPAKNLKDLGATDIIIPMAWKNQLPFFLATSVQAGYAKSAMVNVLASNLNKPDQGYSGSGIYKKEATSDTQYTFITGDEGIRALAQDIVIQTSVRGVLNDDPLDNLKNENILSKISSGNYRSEKLNLAESNFNKNISVGNVTCTFQGSLTSSQNSDIFYLLAVDSNIKYQQNAHHIKACSILACTEDKITTCGNRVTTSITFENVTIIANTGEQQNYVDFPATYDSLLIPFLNVNYLKSVSSANLTASKLSKPNMVGVVQLLAGSENSSSTVTFSMLLLFVVLMLKTVIY